MAPTRKKSSNKQPSPPPVMLSNGMRLSKPTSYASRKRSHPGLSMNDILNCSSVQQEIVDYAATFSPLSVAQYTWGAPITAGIPAVQSRRKHGGLRRVGFRRGRKSIYEEGMPDPEPEENLPNSPERSKLLYVSLEIRELIYGYLLLHERAIVLHSDWRTVLRTSVHDHGILRVCKLLAVEGTHFLYARNSFTGRINEKPTSSLVDVMIDADFLKFMKNVTIYIPSENQEAVWAGEISKCVARLVRANACLESLTIVAAPRANKGRGGFRFADLFHQDSSLLRAISRLTAKKLKISIGHPANHPQRRTTFSIDLWALQLDRNTEEQEQSLLAKDIVAEKSRKKAVATAYLELRRVKERIAAVMDEITADMGRMAEEAVAAEEGLAQLGDAGNRLMESGEDGITA